MTRQQSKMVVCAEYARSKGLKGEARKSFMRRCLRKDSSVWMSIQQSRKFKSCRKASGDSKGMFKACLRKKLGG